MLAALAVISGGLWLWIGGGDQASASYRIGILHPSRVDIATVEGLQGGLAELGYFEGGNVQFEYDGPAGHGERLDAAAADLVARGVDIIFVSSTPATKAVMRATGETRTPVVFGPVNDPLAAGVVNSLRRPSGNITGVTPPPSDGRRMQWLADIAPAVRRVLVPYNPDDASSTASLTQAMEGAETMSLHVVARPVRSEADITSLLADLPRDIDAMFLPRDALITARIEEISAAAIERRLPVSAPGFIQVEAGALYSYGFVHTEIGRHAAKLVDQILRGSDPANLPVESADAFLFINLRTARAIGLEIPDHALRQAKQILR